MRRYVVAAALLAAGGAAAQEQFTVKTESVRRSGGLATVNFSATNQGRTTESVFTSCTFFAGETPIETNTGLVTNVRPGQKAFGKVSIPDDKSITGAECRYAKTSSTKF